MNLLFLTTKFPLNPGAPYLTNDICAAFLARGHRVTVVNIDWHDDNGGYKEISSEGLRVFNVPPLRLKGIPKILARAALWSLSSLYAYTKVSKLIKREIFDAVIVTSPLTVFAFFLAVGRPRLKGKLISLCWDFFPFHQIQLGLIPKALAATLKACEESIYRRSDRICTLSHDYQRFLQHHYKISAKNESVVSGLWGGPLKATRLVTEAICGVRKELVIVFGGQIIEGRGLDNLFHICRVAAMVNPDIRILIIGKGSMLQALKETAAQKQVKNILFADPVPRTEYVTLIANCMAGLISLDSNNHCPAFPSKIVDYSRAALPILVIDNNNPSIEEFVSSREIGYYVNHADIENLKRAITTLANDKHQKRKLSENSKQCFVKDFDPMKASISILPESTSA